MSLPGITSLNFVIGTSVSEIVVHIYIMKGVTIYIIKGVTLNSQKNFIGRPKRSRLA